MGFPTKPHPAGTDRSRRRFLISVPIAAMGVAVGACSDDSSDATGASERPGSKVASTPTGSTADSGGSEWPVYGHDHAQTRTNVAETTITRETVRGLTMDWEIADLVGVTGTPTVVDGVAYFADWKGAVWAVRPTPASEVWTGQIGGMIVGAPAVDGDGVFVSSGASLFRLDRATGVQELDGQDRRPSPSPDQRFAGCRRRTGPAGHRQLRELPREGRVPVPRFDRRVRR